MTTTGTHKSLSVEGLAETQEENLDMVANTLSVEGFFLNVTVNLKVRPGLACGVAPKYDCGRLIAASKGKTRTPTHGRIMSICHPDCPYFSKRTDFSRNVIFSGSGNEHVGTEMPNLVSVTQGSKALIRYKFPVSYS